ncbi:unnamed protein product [Schistosoma mattheei]|uniref:Uncharacterized protein n=1 Tax=Schistosoma mattheei TaxID=31246 RepID=A0A183NMP3_9TREM|nr:unnamed protein product [Schistosoma mattheei]
MYWDAVSDLFLSYNEFPSALLAFFFSSSYIMYVLFTVLLKCYYFLLQILYYFVSLFISNGLTKQVASYANLGTGVTILIGSLASIFIIDRKGRRPLLIFGISACLFSLLLFTLTLIIKQMTGINKLTILSIVLTYTFLFGFSVSLGKSVSK